MGPPPRSPPGAMRECVTSLRQLLDGEELSADGKGFAFHEVKLTYPATEELPLIPDPRAVYEPKASQRSR